MVWDQDKDGNRDRRRGRVGGTERGTGKEEEEEKKVEERKAAVQEK